MRHITILLGWFIATAIGAQTNETKTIQSLIGSRPDIILVLVDDLGKGELSAYGNFYLKTPNLDHFKNKSTAFEDFHVEPTGAPTRSALLSGRHSFKNGVTHTMHECHYMDIETTTFAQLLQTAGYKTGIFGKWQLGDEEPFQPMHRGFDEVFIHGGLSLGQTNSGSCADFPLNGVLSERYMNPLIRHNNMVVKTKGYCTDVFFQQALSWIKTCDNSEEPFFCLLAPNAPHSPFIAPEADKKKFKDAGWDERTQARYGMIENIDRNFGLLMKKFDQWKIWDHALVIFMSDNGRPAMGLHGTRKGRKIQYYNAGYRNYKGSPYQGGTITPAFWRWKNVLPEGQENTTMLSGIDLFDTFCELAGVEIPETVQARDGTSMVPILEDPEYEPWDRFVITHKGRWAPNENPDNHKYDGCAVRSAEWRLVNNTELYRVAADWAETNDVAEYYPDVVNLLKETYEEWWAEVRPMLNNQPRVYKCKKSPFELLYEKQKLKGDIPNWTTPIH